MEKRIDLEKRHRSPDQVTELNLDNCRSTTVEGLTDEFVNLHTLSLISVGLTSLKGFPKLPKLKKLELSENRISGGLAVLKDCEKLTVLNLSNNKIKDLTALQDLRPLANLRVLDLYRNDVTGEADYRDKVFDMLPQLTYLDGSDKGGKEYEESDVEDEEAEIKMNGNKRPAPGGGAKVGPGGAAAAAQDGDGDSDSLSDDDDEDGEEEEDGSEDDGVGLKAIYNDNLEDDSDSDIYAGGEEEEEEDDISDDSADEADASLNRSNVSGRASNNATLSTSNDADGEEGEEEEGEEEEEEDAAEEDGASNDQSVPRGTKRKFEEEEETT
ncbi:Acidic leucine-rich nuclear phosphoprotein 32 family member A [Orchesella cincta]|uniref:Acidic leucine-rich nuclear phosphoprotein 32 family member A n=1 Tax=Orchesella cincta TaxID=48709 RepID=A0A1D2MIH1_ORCCI|nr:Acidic leucine-rich nuclear phosphoprotein 32 family member A [Orchesella cincta]